MKLHATLDLINFLQKMDAENVAFNLEMWYGSYASGYLERYSDKNLHVCGTTACVAGLIAADSGMSDKFGLLPSRDKAGRLQGVGADIDSHNSITSQFAKTLGIPFADAERLLATCDSTRVRDFYYNLTGETLYLREVTLCHVILALYTLLNNAAKFGELNYAE